MDRAEIDEWINGVGMAEAAGLLLEASGIKVRRAREVGEIVAKHPLPPYSADLELTAAEYVKLSEKWKAFRGLVSDIGHFGMTMALPGHREDEIPMYAFVEYSHGKVAVDVLDEDEVPVELLPPVAVPAQLKAQLRIGPNDRCPCGSGKKYKKCCG
jgi:hypothetical protein